MQHDLVETRAWFTREDYIRGLALAQLAPGPLAAQLAMYLGWLRGGALGAALVGVTFVLPSLVVPFLDGGVVREYGWLDERQFLDAVAVAMITPGPVVITVAFIGYLVRGTPGALVAAAGVLAPCWLFIVGPAPFYERIAGNPRVVAFVDGITAAATGAIAGATVVLAKRALVDLQTVAICAIALLVLTFVKRIPEPLVILAAGVWSAAAKLPLS